MNKIQSTTFTEREWRCLAWMVASIAWVPDAWTNEIGSISRKLREFLGDDAVRSDAKPPVTP